MGNGVRLIPCIGEVVRWVRRLGGAAHGSRQVTGLVC